MLDALRDADLTLQATAAGALGGDPADLEDAVKRAQRMSAAEAGTAAMLGGLLFCISGLLLLAKSNCSVSGNDF